MSSTNLTPQPNATTDLHPAEVRLFKEIKNLVGGSELTPANITGITIALMVLAEDKTWKLSGAGKKQAIVKALDSYIDKEVSNPQLKGGLQLLTKNTIPPLIDSLVSVSKGEIVIKAKKCIKKVCCWK